MNPHRINAVKSLRPLPLLLLLALAYVVGCGGGITAAANIRTLQTQSQGNPQTLTLTKGETVERELAGGRKDVFLISLAADQFLHADFGQKEIDLSVTVTGPDGKQVTKVNDFLGKGSTEQVSFVSTVAGTYKIAIASVEDAKTTGRYQAKLVEVREASARDREWMTARLHYEESVRLASEEKEESYRASINELSQALETWRKLGDKRMQALTLSLLGMSYRNLSENPRVVPLYQEMLALWHELDERHEEARTLSRLAALYFTLGDSKKATEYYERALPPLHSMGDRYYESWNLNAFGVLLLSLGQYQRALELFEESLRIRQEISDLEGQATTIKNLGFVYQVLNEPRRALEYYERSLRVGQGAMPRRERANTLVHMGNLYVELGENQKGVDLLQQAFEILREVGLRYEEAKALDGLAFAHRKMGDRPKAIDLYTQSLRITREMNDSQGEAIILANLGDVHSDGNENEKALSFYQQALDASRSYGYRVTESSVLFSQARLSRRQGNLQNALAQIEDSISIVESIRADLGSEQLRSSYFAAQRQKYEFYINVLMQLHQSDPAAGYDALALKASEHARARSLLELLNEARVDIHGDIDRKLLEEEQSLQKRIDANTQKLFVKTERRGADAIAALKKETDDLLNNYEEVEARIRQQSPRYAGLARPQPLGVREIQQQVLDSDTLLLEFSLSPERSYLWLVSQNEVKSFELPKQSEIEQAARHVYELLTARGQRPKFETSEERRARIVRSDAEFAQASALLSRMTLSPVASRIGKKRLLIVADGALYYIPFAALPEPSPGGQPLIINHEIVSSPSASALAELRRETAGRKPAPRAVAVLADPVFDRNDARVGASRARYDTIMQQRVSSNDQNSRTGALPTELASAVRDSGGADDTQLARLPFTRSEASQILSLAPAMDRMEALDFDASRATATSRELSQYRIVHFATHGFLDAVHPKLSGIVLSLVDEQGVAQDGFLSAHDIYNLKLPAELIVLSGCRTGLGQEIKGEGLVGLTRGFMYAGAARVLVSLWDVNDEATSELMARFYNGVLGDEHLSPSVALRRAQVSMLSTSKWQSPYYWSAFLLQGEPR